MRLRRAGRRLARAAWRGGTTRRGAVAVLAMTAVASGGWLADAGPSGPLPVALVARATPPTGAVLPGPTGSAAGRYNTGATHSPRLLRMLAGPPGAARPAVTVPAGEALGIDVSSKDHPNGAPIDWAKVAAAGYKFAFIKATEGSYYVNPYYASDVAAASAAGLFTAAYHFAIPNNSSGTLQADLAVNAAEQAAPGGTSLPLILDAEYDPYVSLDHTNECYGLSQTAMTAWIGAFVAEVVRRTGEHPAIYTTSDWWKACTGDSTAFGADPLWIASWGAPATTPPGWTAWTYWQFTSTATVPGISVKTDVSYYSPATLSAADESGQADPTGTSVSLPVRSLAAAAGNAMTYSATGLPPGLALDPSAGVISGTLPAQPGSYPVTVTLTGPAAQTATVAFTWLVHGPVQLSSPGRRSGTAGSFASVRVSASDGLPGCSLTFTATGLPPGLAITPCGRITGFPYRSGSYRTTVQVGDSASPALATTTFGWTIGPARVITAGHVGLALGSAGKCLADLPGRAGPALKIWSCGKSAGQRWNLATNGTVRQGGQCLTTVALTSGKLTAALRACTGDMAQIWQQAGQGALVSAQAGQCLTDRDASLANGSAVILAECAGTQRQAWTLPPGPLSPGIRDTCLAGFAASGDHAAQFKLARCRGAASQRWTITPEGAITLAGLCLDTGTAPAPGTPVTLAACDTRSAQRWRPLPGLATSATTEVSATGTAGVFLVNPATGLCLDAPATAPSSSPLALAYCVAGYPRLTWRTS